MGVLLEIKAGPMAGKVIALTTGQTVTVGRAAGRAEFALPHDTFMSGLHFVVECGAQGCRVVDRKSSNGTFLNGARIQDAMLANGDEIKSGQTIFTVRIVADAKLASLTPSPGIPPTRDAPQPGAVPDPPRPARHEPPAREPKLEPPAVHDVPRPAPPSRAEPAVPPPAMRSGEPSREVLDSALTPAAGSEPEENLGSPLAAPAEPGAYRVTPPADRAVDRIPPRAATSEPPAGRGSPLAEPPVRGVPSSDSGSPHWEEPPRVRSIPTPPIVPTPPRGVPSLSGAAPDSQRRDLGSQRGADAPVNAPRPPDSPRQAVPSRLLERPAERGVPRPADGSREAAFTVMGWSFPTAPPEWIVQEGFGLQQAGHEEFPSSVAATEELLGGITLPQFVESQISMLRGYLRDARIEPTMPPRVGGADESMAVDVRHSTKDGRELVYRRIYARSGTSVGVLTVTTLADEFPQVLQSLQPLLDGAAFRGTVNSP